MKLYLTNFRSNGVKLEDVVYDFQTGINPDTGIRSVYFKTRDKYVCVETNASIFIPNVVAGSIIRIHPYIDIEDRVITYDDPDPEWQDQYFNHPDFFSLELVVPDPEYYGEEEDTFASLVTPCKNAYIVTYVPWKHIHESGNGLQETSLIPIDYGN